MVLNSNVGFLHFLFSGYASKVLGLKVLKRWLSFAVLSLQLSVKLVEYLCASISNILLIETWLVVFMTLLNLAVGRCFYSVNRFRWTRSALLWWFMKILFAWFAHVEVVYALFFGVFFAFIDASSSTGKFWKAVSKWFFFSSSCPEKVVAMFHIFSAVCPYIFVLFPGQSGKIDIVFKKKKKCTEASHMRLKFNIHVFFFCP